MEGLVDSSRNKEIYIQAELYRLLKNVCSHPAQKQPIHGSNITSSWEPHDVLIEPTIIPERNKNKEADLLLIGRTREPPLKTRPILIIEVKKRRLSQLSKYYRRYLRQAYDYAHAIDCRCYSVYDGNTWIIMQIAEPYLIAFFQKRIGVNHKDDIIFSEKLWNIAGSVQDAFQNAPIGEFSKHDDFLPWKKVLHSFLRDAFQRNVTTSRWEPSEAQLKKKASMLEKIWLELNREYLV